jgi:hypothetical protein
MISAFWRVSPHSGHRSGSRSNAQRRRSHFTMREGHRLATPIDDRGGVGLNEHAGAGWALHAEISKRPRLDSSASYVPIRSMDGSR